MLTIPKVTVRVSGPNLKNGPVTGILRVGDMFHLALSAEDCEVPTNTEKYDYQFEVISID